VKDVPSDVQSVPDAIASHHAPLSGTPPKVYPPSRTPGCLTASLGKRGFLFFVSVNPVVGLALRRKVGGLAGRLSRSGSLYAVITFAGQRQTIIGSHHSPNMCTNDATYEVRLSAVSYETRVGSRKRGFSVSSPQLWSEAEPAIHKSAVSLGAPSQGNEGPLVAVAYFKADVLLSANICHLSFAT